MHKANILIADDDAALVKALAIRLEAQGYRVTRTLTGYNALAEAVQTRPDLLVLDINMPAGDGFTVHERIENMSATGSVPVIYITGDTSDEAREIAARRGAFALLHKPLDMARLLDTIRRALIGVAA